MVPWYAGEESSEVSVVQPGNGEARPQPVRPALEDAQDPRADAPHATHRERQLLEKVERLEAELERHRAHAQRTSKLFLSATNYAEWVRESARRDAEGALRKARARIDALDREHERRLRELGEEHEQRRRELADQQAEGERERARLQGELDRLRALTEETRERLSAFLTAGMEVLDAGVESEEGAEQASWEEDDLQDALHDRVPSASRSGSGMGAHVERSDP